MRKRTRKNGKLVVSANSNEQKVKFYDKKAIKKKYNSKNNKNKTQSNNQNK